MPSTAKLCPYTAWAGWCQHELTLFQPKAEEGACDLQLACVCSATGIMSHECFEIANHCEDPWG